MNIAIRNCLIQPKVETGRVNIGQRELNSKQMTGRVRIGESGSCLIVYAGSSHLICYF